MAKKSVVGNAETVSEKTETPEVMPVVDLYMSTSGHWPSNHSIKKASVYLDIEEITLTTNQLGKLIQTPEGFVLERIDLVVLKPVAMDCSLKFVSGDHDIAAFDIKSGSDKVERKATEGVQAGDYLPEAWINLMNLGDKPQGEGRLAMSFIGYLIEPWR